MARAKPSQSSSKNALLSASLFLIGLTLLLDALGAGFVLSQVPTGVFDQPASLIWSYVIVRFIAGIMAVIAAVAMLGK